MQNITSKIELFHLLFLRQLGDKIDKKLYALKGGCNLRFFFKSIRYSEDIDFDVTTISRHTLENKVNRILESTNFKQVLQSKGIEIIRSSSAKQTETTQRWKILLRSRDSTLSIPTKIEFSRRYMDQNVIYEAVDNDVVTQYGLYPIICNHYVLNAAFFQKANALIKRTETQTRDIFDLKWLLDQGANPKLNAFSADEIQLAIKHIEGMNYTDFKGQVVAYLIEEYKKYYDSPGKWNEICAQVINTFRGNNNAAD